MKILTVWMLGMVGSISLIANASNGDSPRIATGLIQQMQSDQEKFDIMLYFGADQSPSANASLQSRSRESVQKRLIEFAKESQQQVRHLLTARNVDFRSYYLGNVIVVDGVDRTTLGLLISNDSVSRMRLNPLVRVLDAAPAPLLEGANEEEMGIGENIVRTGADKVWAEFQVKGAGVVVGNQDTGIDWDHPGLKNQYRGWNGSQADHAYNWHDAIQSSDDNPCGFATTEPCDDNGHGTHTLGSTLGDDGEGNQVGLAPEAKWIACRNMDAGLGRPSTYIECFQFFLAPWPNGGDPERDGRPELGADVMNNSWGCPESEGCEGDEFLPVLQSLKEAGVMVIAAAGNAGSACGTINDGPSHHSDLVFSVGAIDHRTDKIASFSSRGPSAFDQKIGPDLSAPGVSIRSTIKGGGYSGFSWSGTSMASPHVVGAVALLWSGRPELVGDIDATSQVLRASAEGKTSSQTCGNEPGSNVPNNTFGHGILNVYEAFKQGRLE